MSPRNIVGVALFVAAAAGTAAVYGPHLRCDFIWLEGHSSGGCLSRNDVARAIAAARQVPAEIRADALIRLSTVHALDGDPLRLSLLREVFTDADRATWTFPIIADRPGRPLDDTSGSYVSARSDQQLDKLSLQSRAVAVLCKFDPKAAADLFARIELPQMPVPACSDAFSPDLSAYFMAAANIAASHPPLPPSLNAVTDTAPNTFGTIAPLLTYWRSTTNDCAQLRKQMHIIRQRLLLLHTTDREFSAALSHGLLARAAQEMQSLCGQCNIGEREVIAAFSAAVARQLKEPRCSDVIRSYQHQRAEAELVGSLPELKARYYEYVLATASASYIIPVSIASDIETEPASSVLHAVQQLRFRVGSRQYTESERRTVEWHEQAERVLATIKRWQSDGWANTRSGAHYRIYFLSSILALTPTTYIRKKMIDELVTSLSEYPLVNSTPGEWQEHIALAVNGLPVSHRAAVLGEMERSNSPMLRLYALLNK